LSKDELEYLKKHGEDFENIIDFSFNKFTKNNENLLRSYSRIITKRKNKIYGEKIESEYAKVKYYSKTDPDTAISITQNLIEIICSIIKKVEKLEDEIGNLCFSDKLDIFVNKKIIPKKIAVLTDILKILVSTLTDIELEGNYYIDILMATLNKFVTWFLNDYLNYDFSVESFDISSSISKENSYVKGTSEKVKLMDIYDAMKINWNLKDLISESIKLDYEAFDDLTPEHTGTVKQWVNVNKHSELWRVLVDENNKMIGYWNMVPLYDDSFEKAINGEVLDSEISVDMIPILLPGVYNVYFVAICLDEKYRNTRSIGVLLQSVVQVAEELAENDIYIDKICAQAYSESGRALCKTLKFDYVKEHIDHGEIYQGTMHHLINRPFARKNKKVIELYESFKKNYYESK
jgi:hypothetical protein